MDRFQRRRFARHMETARYQMNDYRLIYNSDETVFTPEDSIPLHKHFALKLLNWFGKNLNGPRVVISHNAPVINPNSKYKGGALTPAFSIPWTWWRSLGPTSRPSAHQPRDRNESEPSIVSQRSVISNLRSGVGFGNRRAATYVSSPR